MELASIRDFIQSQLLEPLKRYPTVQQDTMIELITQKLEELYELTVRFPEIIAPNKYRLDVLKVIADQFVFAVREDADLQEQLDILDHILYVYNRRGSIDTIENMWKYYGGKLPRDVKVNIPSYNLFRYSISTWSGKDVFQDNSINRTGVYEIRLTNNTYPIPDLKEFLIKELVAAGNYIYFTNTLHMDLTEDNELSEYNYKYIVYEDTYINLQLAVLKSHQGLNWSGINPLSRKSEDSAWSGRPSIFLELTHTLELGYLKVSDYAPYENLGFTVAKLPTIDGVIYTTKLYKNTLFCIEHHVYSTPQDYQPDIARYFYNKSGELITSSYPGYFIIGETLLGKEII